MKNPFIVGDQVYTAGSLEPWKVKEVGDGVVLLGSCPVPVKIEQLSFKPWPAPCHERPIEDGWWVCSDKTQREPLPLVRKVFKGKVEYTVGLTTVTTRLEQWDFHKFLGKDWK